MERLGVPLDRCHLMGWHNVIAYARHLAADSGSHVWRAKYNEESNYATPLHLAAQLADVYDLIQALYIALTTKQGRKPRPLKPYPRPWAKDRRQIGKGAIPISQFDQWYYGGD